MKPRRHGLGLALAKDLREYRPAPTDAGIEAFEGHGFSPARSTPTARQGTSTISRGWRARGRTWRGARP